MDNNKLLTDLGDGGFALPLLVTCKVRISKENNGFEHVHFEDGMFFCNYVFKENRFVETFVLHLVGAKL